VTDDEFAKISGHKVRDNASSYRERQVMAEQVLKLSKKGGYGTEKRVANVYIVYRIYMGIANHLVKSSTYTSNLP
jgi:hypothetical protein